MLNFMDSVAIAIADLPQPPTTAAALVQARPAQNAAKKLDEGSSCIIIGATDQSYWFGAAARKLARDGTHLMGLLRSHAQCRQVAEAMDGACVPCDLRVLTLDTCKEVSRFLADLQVRQARIQGLLCDLGGADDLYAQTHRLTRFVHRLHQLDNAPGIMVFGQSVGARSRVNADRLEEGLLETMLDLSGENALVNFVNIEDEMPEATELGADVIAWLLKHHQAELSRRLWVIEGNRAWVQPLRQSPLMTPGYWYTESVN